MSNEINIPEEIKKIRKTLGLSQRKFAPRVGVSREILANMETGRQRVYADVWQKAQDLLDEIVPASHSCENISQSPHKG